MPLLIGFQEHDGRRYEVYHRKDEGLITRPILLIAEDLLARECKHEYNLAML
jgi:hypothetical protein